MSKPESTMLMRSPLIAARSFSWSSVRFLEPPGHTRDTLSNHQGTVCSRFHETYLSFQQQHFIATGDGIITSCSKWSAFAFTNRQQYLPRSEPQIPLVDTWLGNAFLLVDISHHLYCLFSSLAQFNTKFNICLLFKLWHFAMWQCVVIQWLSHSPILPTASSLRTTMCTVHA